MSHSFIDRSSNYFRQNYDNEETQKKIDPIAQLKEINNTTVREWGLFNNHPAQMFAKEEDLSAGVKEEEDENIQAKEKKQSSSLPKDIKMTIAADKEAKLFSKEYMDNFAVGHSWIMLETSAGLNDSYGFWPANLGNGGGVDTSKPWKSVAGEVRHPDTAHTPKAKYSIQIDKDQLKKGKKYAADNASKKYNLFSYNCTTFAREFFKQSSGKHAPSGGMLIENPNGLYNNIESRNGFKGLDSMENEKPTKKNK